ncbi:MAG: response regulator [Anaerolineae bacterium]
MSPKILVIDDHKETLDLVSLVLQKQGYRVSIAHSGQQGLDLASQELPDLVLLDVMMPDMDGFTVCRKIRATEGLRDTPVILLTAKSQADEKWEGFEAGATDYLIKPTNAEELHRRVKTILVNHNSQKDSASLDPETTSGAVNSPLSRSQVTVFLGARGGCGTTTAALNTAFAHSISAKTLLVDLDMMQGHVGLYLNQKVSAGLNELAAGSPLSLAGQVANNWVTVSPQLTILPAKPNIDGELPMLESNHLPSLVEAMQSSGSSVIVDGGRGIHGGNASVIERADQIVICTNPDRVSLANARQLIKSLNELVLPTCQLHVLLISIGGGSKLPQEKVEKYLATAVADSITISPAKLASAINNGRPIVIAYPDDPLTAQFRQLAEKVATL